MFVACDEACRITLGVVILLALVCIISKLYLQRILEYYGIWQAFVIEKDL